MSQSVNFTIAKEDEGLRLLLARLEDLSHKAARGEWGVTSFLTPREAKYARVALASRMSTGTAALWGGYPEAERVRALILPDYTEGLVDPVALALRPAETLNDAGLYELSEALSEAVCPLAIKGSGFRELSHRDYLGSVLGLGLERDAVGDILIPDAHNAILVTDTRVGDFLSTSLSKVATDTVKVSRLPDNGNHQRMAKGCLQ